MTVMGHQSFFETEKSPQTRMNTKKNVPDSKIRHIIWWERVDSDHRRQSQQIYSLPPLATREHSHIKFAPFSCSSPIGPYSKGGAGGRTQPFSESLSCSATASQYPPHTSSLKTIINRFLNAPHPLRVQVRLDPTQKVELVDGLEPPTC